MPHRILIAEDEAIVALDLGEIILSLGYVLVGYARTAADAIARTESEKPDLVLMDIRLGLSDGITAAQDIRRRLDVPVVFVSAHGNDLDRRGLSDLGKAVPKPFTVAMLKSAIEETLGRKAA